MDCESRRKGRRSGRRCRMREVPINPGLVIERRLSIIGSGNPTFGDVRRGIALMESGSVRPQIDRTMPFESASHAHELVRAAGTGTRARCAQWMVMRANAREPMAIPGQDIA